MRVSKQPEERRRELIAAARQLFDEKGVEKTRVSDIVKRVGVAQGVFYYYFAGKEEVVEVVIAQVLEEISARQKEILAGTALPVGRRVAAYVTLYMDCIDGFLADDATSAEPLREGSLAGNALLAQCRALLVEGWVQLVQQAAGMGQLRLQYPAETARMLLYGLEQLAVKSLPTRQQVHTLVAQGLGLMPETPETGRP